ncbi:MAG: DJ-1/PfpI family protein [Candidatus Rokubacteria bacterium]|nr:DJ-1/PfpI family protein [Candidatus Rokubacteria bacterium]
MRGDTVRPIKKIAFFIFPGLTLLDLVGAYDSLRRVALMGIDPALTHRFIGTQSEISDETGIVLRPDAVYDDLSTFDLLYLPGGVGTRRLMGDDWCLDYLRRWGVERPIASVCTGALLLGKAGYLRDKRATTHRNAYDLLAPYCREVVRDRRIVDEGNVITAGGVSSALDLGLYLVERFWGDKARERIAQQMEYRPALEGAARASRPGSRTGAGRPRARPR